MTRRGVKIPTAGHLGLCLRSPSICNLCYTMFTVRRGRTSALRAVVGMECRGVPRTSAPSPSRWPKF
jgi:hypothetical protein